MSSHNGLAAKALHDRIDAIASNLKSVIEQLSSAASSVKDRASDVTSHAMSGASSLGTRTGKAIQNHPIAAIAIALGAGYLVVRWMRR
jgi:ElaB/YqjD/DUF883 family membrane-anchored ribosome-binding protein